MHVSCVQVLVGTIGRVHQLVCRRRLVNPATVRMLVIQLGDELMSPEIEKPIQDIARRLKNPELQVSDRARTHTHAHNTQWIRPHKSYLTSRFFTQTHTHTHTHTHTSVKTSSVKTPIHQHARLSCAPGPALRLRAALPGRPWPRRQGACFHSQAHALACACGGQRRGGRCSTGWLCGWL